MKKLIEIYDTTLRDGGQSLEVDLTKKNKLDLIDILDGYGFDYIEIGMPRKGTLDMDLVKSLDQKKYKSKLVFFGMTKKPNIKVEHDVCLNTLIEAGTYSNIDTATLVAKAWDFHLDVQFGLGSDRKKINLNSI